MGDLYARDKEGNIVLKQDGTPAKRRGIKKGAKFPTKKAVHPNTLAALEAYKWKQGQTVASGLHPPTHNGGRSRSALSRAFVQALKQDFDIHGPDVIAKAREEDPSGYLRIIASLLPKEVEVKTNRLDELSDEQLDAAITAARAILSASDSARCAEAEGADQPPA
jgi:hypothetical protein